VAVVLLLLLILIIIINLVATNLGEELHV